MFVLAEPVLCPYCVPVCLISTFDFLQVGGVFLDTLLTLPDIICVHKGVTHILALLNKLYYCPCLPTVHLYFRNKLTTVIGAC